MSEKHTKTISVEGTEITILQIDDTDYICITDMLKAKDGDFVVKDWLRNRNTIEFLGVWESLYNPSFNRVEFDAFRHQAERLAKLLRPGDVLAYTGPMGAGKTTFTVGLARGLGSTDWVSSPTFALVQEYRGPLPLCHFDFYRITGVDDLYATGYFDYLDGSRILAVEWSERIPEALPENALHIDFTPLEGDARRIVLTGDERLAALQP